MPSPFGHALAGLTIAYVVGRSDEDETFGEPSRHRLPLVAAGIATLPDFDLLIPHFHRTATHSLAATAMVLIVVAAVTRKVTGRAAWRTSFVLAAAYGSHVLLDWLGLDPFRPQGLQVLWPFSRDFLISGWDVFPPTERRLWDHTGSLWVSPRALAINARAFVTELVILGPLAAASWLAARPRLATRTRRSPGPTSAPDALRPPFA